MTCVLNGNFHPARLQFNTQMARKTLQIIIITLAKMMPDEVAAVSDAGPSLLVVPSETQQSDTFGNLLESNQGVYGSNQHRSSSR